MSFKPCHSVGRYEQKTTPARGNVIVLKQILNLIPRQQSLKLGTFLGHSANAVRWQVFTALLLYVLLRYMAHLSACGHSFTRLFAVSRSALWERLNLLELLKSYGPAFAFLAKEIQTPPKTSRNRHLLETP